MNVHLTNILQIIHVNLQVQSATPRLTTYNLVNVIATTFCDC